MGVTSTMKKAAVELAKFMCQGKAEYLDKLYKKKMLPEDYKIWKTAVENAYYIPRFIPGMNSFFDIARDFVNDMNNGMSVEQHVNKWNGKLQGFANKYNSNH